jgi:hypothetical protein
VTPRQEQDAFLGFVATMMGGIAVCLGIIECTPAERQTVATDIGKDGAGVCAVVDIVAAALNGASVPAIAALCTASEDAIVAILDAEGLPSDDAGPAQILRAADVAKTPAYKSAETRLAAKRSKGAR